MNIFHNIEHRKYTFFGMNEIDSEKPPVFLFINIHLFYFWSDLKKSTLF